MGGITSLLKTYLIRLVEQTVSYRWKLVLQFIEPDAKAIALDCGCDTGSTTELLVERLGIGPQQVHGIELVVERARQAQARGYRVHISDLNAAFPLDDNTVDVIHASEVIEHLCDPDNFVREVFRVLRPGGYAIITTENLSSWHNIGALLLGWQAFSSTNFSLSKLGVGNPLALHREEPASSIATARHVFIFAYRGLKEIFEVNGFYVECITGAGYHPLPFGPRLGQIDPRHAAFLVLKARKPYTAVG